MFMAKNIWDVKKILYLFLVLVLNELVFKDIIPNIILYH